MRKKKKQKIIPPLTLVRWDYERLPESWRKNNPNPHHNTTFIYFGEITNQPGHSYVQDAKTGIPQVFHTSDLIVLTEEEV